MKTKKLIAPLVTGVLFAAAANDYAQTASFPSDVHITITGSTAFRNIAIDAIKALFDSAPTHVGNDKDAAFGGCYFGTMNNVLGTGSQVVEIHDTFSGSAAGATALFDQQLIGVTYKDSTQSTNGNALTPDLSFSDNWPAAMAAPIANNKFDDQPLNDVIGVNVFTWVVNNNLYSAGLTNIDRETAKLLLTASGNQDGTANGMPANFIGGSNTNLIWLFGRDIGSGTRITTFATLGFAGTPTQYAVTNTGAYTLAADIAGQTFAISGNGISVASSAYVKTNSVLNSNPSAGALSPYSPAFALDGFDSGGTLVTVLDQATNTIGYAGYPDASANGANHTILTFEGQTAAATNVENGSYPFWSYEHLLSVGITGQKATIKSALLSGITNSTFQQTDANYFNNGTKPQAARLANMLVKRNVDGGPISTTTAGTAVYGF